jgi:hypothetical protein
MFANDKIVTGIKQEGFVTKMGVYEKQEQRKENTAILHQTENKRISSKSITDYVTQERWFAPTGLHLLCYTIHKSVKLRPLFGDTGKTDYNKMEKRWREIKRPQFIKSTFLKQKALELRTRLGLYDFV